MAQAMHLGAINAPTSMDKKTYAVNFKGLMKHLVDILFAESQQTRSFYGAELSSHMQRDVGLSR